MHGLVVGAQDDSVVTAVDRGIRDCHVRAAVDMHSVRVRVVRVAEYPYPVDRDEIAAVYPVCPAARHFEHRDIPHA